MTIPVPGPRRTGRSGIRTACLVLAVAVAGPGTAHAATPEAAVSALPSTEVPAQRAAFQVPGGSGPTSLPSRARAAIGLLALLFVAWLTSSRQAPIPWRVVIWGLALQLAFGLLVLRTPFGADLFDAVDHGLHAILDHAEEGARFVFGNLTRNHVPVGSGVAGTNDPLTPTPGQVARSGAFFAFNVLTAIIFVSSLMAVLYHLGVMQRIVRGAAWVMHRTMGTSGAETVATAGNVFVGLMEAPLFVAPYVQSMTRSELMALMAGGFATVSGGTLAAYVGMLSPYYPGIAGHLIAASVMSAPAALVVAKLMLPETETPRTADALVLAVEREDVNVIDAAARGASDGLRLALSVAAMLIAFLALLALLDGLLGWIGAWFGRSDLTLSWMLGVLLRPVAWLIGIPWAEAGTVGQLIGVKTVLNEFVAFLQLTDLQQGEAPLSPRSVAIASYALAGFANVGSVAMTIAGIGEIAPSRRSALARLGMRAMVGGAIAGLMTAAVAALLM